MTRRRVLAPKLGSRVVISGEVVGLLVQLLLIWLGITITWGDEMSDMILELVLWCVVAGLYLGAVVVGLGVQVRQVADESPMVRAIVAHPVARWLSFVTTFLSSLVGLSVALELITSLGQEQQNILLEICGVAAMLLSWSMFNWGYARMYYSHYYRAASPPLEFPGTQTPRLADFAYFAFTNATTFGVSDVRVMSSRMRWNVVWHTTLAFFFNALIIVLTMNIIASGELFAELFD